MSRRSVVLTLLLTLLSAMVTAGPVAADTTPNAVTWSFTDANTISAVGRIEIYPLCPRCPGAVDEGFAAKVKAQIERVWRQSRPTYKCADVVITADVKVGTDASHVDPDRVAVAIDNTVIDDRSQVVSQYIEESKWNSNDPADRVVPVNSDDPDNSTTWIWSNSLRPGNSIYAHEFGHVLGLADQYHAVAATATVKAHYEPYPDAGVDVMSTPRSGLIEQATIDRLVDRHGDILDLSKLPGCSSPPPTAPPSGPPSSDAPAADAPRIMTGHITGHTLEDDTATKMESNVAIDVTIRVSPIVGAPDRRSVAMLSGTYHIDSTSTGYCVGRAANAGTLELSFDGLALDTPPASGSDFDWGGLDVRAGEINQGASVVSVTGGLNVKVLCEGKFNVVNISHASSCYLTLMLTTAGDLVGTCHDSTTGSDGSSTSTDYSAEFH